MEELVMLEGAAAAHVIGTLVVNVGVANGWSCSSHCYDERGTTSTAISKD